MSFTYEEHIWFGGAYPFDTPDKTNTKMAVTGGSWVKAVPERRVWRVTIRDNLPLGIPKTFILPDARTLPKGGPLYHFIVTGEPGVPQFRFTDNTYGGFFLTFNLPVSVKLYLVDNTTETGVWAWKAGGFILSTQSAQALIVSFGSDPNLGNIDKYNYVSNSWSTEPDSGNDWFRAGVSYTGPRALIRVYGTIWTHTAGTTALQTLLGFADVSKCSFIRASGAGIGSRHYGLGNYDNAAPVNDFYEFVPNTFTIFGIHASVDWTEATASAVTTVVTTQYMLLQTIAYFAAPFDHDSWLWVINSAVWVSAQKLHGHNHWAPSCTIYGGVHVLGGASYRSNLFDTGTRWNQRYSGTWSGWLNQPWIPGPLHGHGCREVPGRLGARRAVFSMGKDHSFFPSDNVFAWRYDASIDTYTVIGSSAWTFRQEQEVSWGHVD